MMEQPFQIMRNLGALLTPPLGKSADISTMVQLIIQAGQQIFAPDLCNVTAINPETGAFFLPPDKVWSDNNERWANASTGRRHHAARA